MVTGGNKVIEDEKLRLTQLQNTHKHDLAYGANAGAGRAPITDMEYHLHGQNIPVINDNSRVDLNQVFPRQSFLPNNSRFRLNQPFSDQIVKPDLNASSDLSSMYRQGFDAPGWNPNGSGGELAASAGPFSGRSSSIVSSATRPRCNSVTQDNAGSQFRCNSTAVQSSQSGFKLFGVDLGSQVPSNRIGVQESKNSIKLFGVDLFPKELGVQGKFPEPPTATAHAANQDAQVAAKTEPSQPEETASGINKAPVDGTGVQGTEPSFILFGNEIFPQKLVIQGQTNSLAKDGELAEASDSLASSSRKRRASQSPSSSPRAQHPKMTVPNPPEAPTGSRAPPLEAVPRSAPGACPAQAVPGSPPPIMRTFQPFITRLLPAQDVSSDGSPPDSPPSSYFGYAPRHALSTMRARFPTPPGSPPYKLLPRSHPPPVVPDPPSPESPPHIILEGSPSTSTNEEISTSRDSTSASSGSSIHGSPHPPSPVYFGNLAPRLPVTATGKRFPTPPRPPRVNHRLRAHPSPVVPDPPSPESPPHIIWEDADDYPRPMGERCMLCKRDLLFSAEGPVAQPAQRPEAAILPCGHTFHDLCLQNMTSPEQSANPSCIACALGEN